MDALKMKYRPEFLNRLDEMVIFNPLGLAQLRAIASLQIKALQGRLAPRRIKLTLAEPALDALTDLGYDPHPSPSPSPSPSPNPSPNPSPDPDPNPNPHPHPNPNPNP